MLLLSGLDLTGIDDRFKKWNSVLGTAEAADPFHQISSVGVEVMGKGREACYIMLLTTRMTRDWQHFIILEVKLTGLNPAVQSADIPLPQSATQHFTCNL